VTTEIYTLSLHDALPIWAVGEVLRIKQQLTGAKTSIDKGSEILDAMAAAVRAQLNHVELLLAAEPPAAPPARAPKPLPAPYPGAEQLPF